MASLFELFEKEFLASDLNNEVLICFTLGHRQQKVYRFRLFRIRHLQELPYIHLLSANVNLDIHQGKTHIAIFQS